MKLLPFEKPLEILYKELERRKRNGEDTLHLEELIEKQMEEIYKKLTPFDTVLVARHPDRPQPQDYINALLTDFTEFHGDRVSEDDPALIAGFGFFKGMPVFAMGTRKGHNIHERLKYHSGMLSPSGFRKAARLVETVSHSFKVPIISFVDTPGAMVSPQSEMSGQVEAIYKSLSALLNANVPVISVITGEGGGLGAIGISTGDRILMLTYSYFAVVSPEAGSAILFKNTEAKSRVASQLHLTARELLSLNVIDGIIEEPLGGAQRFKNAVIKSVGDALQSELETLLKEPVTELKKRRLEKYESMGVFTK
ncbi:MAG: acetyl-CoA carboxylase carboxyl transferase subunit alpha [Caldisericaceae bacterium]|nr:acetyl-CoA carboxylase carboxyl transferase subunit alpha [Caldisericaceae bacterium]